MSVYRTIGPTLVSFDSSLDTTPRLLVLSHSCSYELCHKKTCFCICENKDADQLRGKTTQLIRAFVFRFIDSTISVFSKSEISSCGCAALFVADLVKKKRRQVFS